MYVPITSVPVLVRANFDDATIRGIEHKLRLELSCEWAFSSAITYLRAKDDRTGLPPNIEGGTPAPEGWFKVRYAPSGRRFSIEPYLHVALEQENLSSLDLSDRRTGATRSRNAIAAFFNNGARARGLIGPGPDGANGTRTTSSRRRAKRWPRSRRACWAPHPPLRSTPRSTATP